MCKLKKRDGHGTHSAGNGRAAKLQQVKLGFKHEGKTILVGCWQMPKSRVFNEASASK